MAKAWPTAAPLLLLLPLLGVQQAPPGSLRRTDLGSASISGRIVAGDTGSALAGAFVVINAAPSPARGSLRPAFEHRTTWTDAQGRYTFAGLPAGRYVVAASPPIHKSMYLDQGAATRAGARVVLVELADGQSRQEVDVVLVRAGAIGGRVLGERGEPLAGVRVQAVSRSSLAFGLASRGHGLDTDDQGRFRIYGLPPGEYYIVAEPSQRGTPFGVMDRDLQTWVATFYPGTTDRDQARMLSLGLAEEITGLDLRLVRAPTFRIAGVVVDAEGRPAPGAMVQISSDAILTSGSSGRQPGPDGTFEFTHLVPGTYTLSARPRPWNAEPVEQGVLGVEITVSSGDVENVTLRMRRGVPVHGQVVTASGSLPSFAPSGLRIRLDAPVQAGTGVFPAVEIGPDWRFSVDSVFAPVVVRLQGRLPAGWYLQAVRYGGQDVTDTPTMFDPDPNTADLEIVLSDRPASLRGVVSDAAGRPRAEARVRIFPDAERWTVWPTGSMLRMRTTVASPRGTYVLVGLPPGDYLVVATGEIDPSWDPSALPKLASQATRVTLAEGERRTLDLRLAEIRQ